MLDAQYKIVQDGTKRYGIYIVQVVLEIVGIVAGCSMQYSPENYSYRSSRPEQRFFIIALSSPKAELSMGNKHGYHYVSLYCHGQNFAVRHGLSATDH